MSFHISIIGIDGSGKSMTTLALANLIAAELGLMTVAVSDGLWGKTADEDLFRPGFAPDGEILTARLNRLLRNGARAISHNRKLYPHLKVIQLAMQEQVARQLNVKYHPDVTLGDGNLLLTSGGWALSYINSRANPGSLASSVDPPIYIEALYDYIVAGKPLPQNMDWPISGLKVMRWLHWLDKQLNLGLTKLPDALIYLDIAPEKALARVLSRDKKPDGHENIHDMVQAQTMLRGVVEFFRRRQGDNNTAVIDVTELSMGQTLEQVIDFVRKLSFPQRDTGTLPGQQRLGTTVTKLSDPATVAQKTLTAHYLIRYMLPNLHRGSAYELTFPLSQLGRLSLKEGYSAGLMKAIYLQEHHQYGLLDRIFLNHPLHKAVYHRLQVLKRVVEKELCHRLEKLPSGKTLKVMTAPSGYAFDLFHPLQQITKSEQEKAKSIHILASDLDPDGRIKSELCLTAQETGFELEFVQGDLTSAKTRNRFKQLGPYDMVVFIGLSAWISKTHLINHLKFIHTHLLSAGGVLFVDCFMPQVSALSGKYMGYKANYYSPAEFTSLLAYSGFDPVNIAWENGPEGIDHVCVARTQEFE